MTHDTLLFEIGTEELPAGYIIPALDMLIFLLKEKLAAARIQSGQAKSFGTPRRLAVIIHDVAARQTDMADTLTGPPVTVGMDASGNYTVPAQKFAEKAGVPLTSLKTIVTDKGEYFSARRVEKGRPTRTILKELLPQILSSMTFPKTMKWGSQKEFFARPVRSIAAIFGSGLIRFSWAGLNSGRYTPGHPFLSPQRIKLDHPDVYQEELKNAYVVTDIETRRNIIVEEINRIAVSLGGQVLPDPDLIDLVTNMVEFPVAACGRFEDKYLALPQEVLITAMRSHQKYFAVIDSEGRLLPSFIVINNNRATDMLRVTKGHERVLRARLEDAMFFYEQDMQIPLGERIDSLRRVLFQARLGALYDKTERIKALALQLMNMLAVHDPGLKADLSRAADLCKSDLVTRMVIEFPRLQGIMGRIYALASGENKTVSQAIEEHYQPIASGTALPESFCGVLLSMADKIDTICGCFAVGLIPSGASDPYALRRQGIGVIQMLLQRNIAISIKGMITNALQPFAVLNKFNAAEVADAVSAFLRGRMAQLLMDESLPKDVVNAVLNASADNIPDVWHRTRALSAMKSRPDFDPLAVAFKRIANIIKKTDCETIRDVNEDLFRHSSETQLFHSCQEVAGKIATSLQHNHYEKALMEIAAMRQPVDNFFDDVLVMAEEPDLRANRLALLMKISRLFSRFADFSVIVTTDQAK